MISTNNAFTLIIKINGRQKEFNFLERKDGNYDTDTSDERSNRYTFRIEKNADGWMLTGKQLPEWLSANEGVIIEALEKSK